MRFGWGRVEPAGDPDEEFRNGMNLVKADPPDNVAGRRWFELAAAAGHTRAMCGLAKLAQMENPPDDRAARRWYQRAADGGDVVGMYWLARLLEERNLKKAKHWYRRAADEGHAGAAGRLAELMLWDMDVDEPDFASIRPLLELSARDGHMGSMYNLGMDLAYHAEPPDLDGARHWLERAAEAGHSGAMTAIGDVYARVVDPPDLEAARHWYGRAAAAGDRGGMHNLEVLFGDAGDRTPGWAVQPPSAAAKQAMRDWLEGPGSGVDKAMTALERALDDVVTAFKRRDLPAVTAASAALATVLARRLPGILPTPDPELTRALQAVVDDANEIQSTLGELSEPLTAAQRATVQGRLGDFTSSMRTAMIVWERDCELIGSRAFD